MTWGWRGRLAGRAPAPEVSLSPFHSAPANAVCIWLISHVDVPIYRRGRDCMTVDPVLLVFSERNQGIADHCTGLHVHPRVLNSDVDFALGKHGGFFVNIHLCQPLLF